MIKYIVLLRGINVGGKNKISMKELAELCRELLIQQEVGEIITYLLQYFFAFYKKLPRFENTEKFDVKKIKIMKV
ncbi:MAG TPA: DUF1697 domain-containing protein [Bacillota bacterium]|nr:DUF1697 domain-containing protein [Bacillota bacterium]